MGNTATVDAVRHALRARVVTLLGASKDDAERADLAKLVDWLADDANRPQMPLLDLLQSPPFYFFFGLVLLIAAFITTYFQLNSSLNFLIAMLGVAVLLYGTGSQAAGTFGTAAGTGNGTGGQSEASKLLETYLAKDPGAATADEVQRLKDAVAASAPKPGISSAAANIAIAGGAAVLTAFFGYGVIIKSNEIRQVFRDYDQYSMVRVEFCYLNDTNCLGSGGGLSGTQADPGTVTQALLTAASLQTGLGRSTFASVVGNGLEFVVFQRDLGDDSQLRLQADINVDGYRYSVDDDYIVLAKDRPCLNGRTTPSCRYVAAVSDSFDGDRIPRFVIRAVINETGNTVLASNSGTDVQAFRPVDPR